VAGPCWWSYFGVHAGDRVLTHRLFPILVGSIAYAHQFGAKNHLFSVFLQLWIAKIANTMVFHHFSWRTPSFFHHFFHGPLVYDPSNTENIGFDKKNKTRAKKKNKLENQTQGKKQEKNKKKTTRQQRDVFLVILFLIVVVFFLKSTFSVLHGTITLVFFKKNTLGQAQNRRKT
jgi:uncharacterized ion transporter superfamily protein YfcC